MNITVVTLGVVLALGGCNESYPEDSRSVGATLADVGTYAELVIYGDLASPQNTTRIMGPREHFAIGGSISDPGHLTTTASISGDGGVVGLEVSFTMVISFASWRADAFRTTIDGTLEVMEHATYRRDGDTIPNTTGSRITGQIRLTGELAGDHAIDLALCDRDFLMSYAWQGTVDGEPVDDHYPGDAPLCQPLGP